MSAPRPFVTYPFHPLSSIHKIRQFLYMYRTESFISSTWYETCVFGRSIFDNCACGLAKTLSSRLIAVIKAILLSIRYVLVLNATKYMTFEHAFSLNKHNRTPSF